MRIVTFLIRAADPRGVLDRQRAGIDLLAVIGRDLRDEVAAQLLERPPQPADAAVGLALVRQPGEQVRPVARDLGQEARLAAPSQQLTDLRDGQQFGVAAFRVDHRVRGLGQSFGSKLLYFAGYQRSPRPRPLILDRYVLLAQPPGHGPGQDVPEQTPVRRISGVYRTGRLLGFGQVLGRDCGSCRVRALHER